MNKVILSGRLTADPEIKYTDGNDQLCIARYRLAVDRRFKKDGEQQADFINCKAFGKSGEFVEKYLTKGMKIIVFGRIQTGSYDHRDGYKVYMTDVIVEEHEFCEKKDPNAPKTQDDPAGNAPDDFVPMADVSDEELPFI